MKGLLLLSGGIDSPIAGLLAKQKNIEINCIHFSIEPFTDDTPFQKSKILAKKLKTKKFFKANAGKFFQQIATKSEHKYYFILSKIFMQKVAEQIAQKNKFECLITGENIAQVSSQTLTNLSIISSSISIPVIRPLIGLDKIDIIKLSEKNNFFETSKGRESCDVLGPKHPSTHASKEKILKELKKCNIDFLVSECLKQITPINLKTFNSALVFE